MKYNKIIALIKREGQKAKSDFRKAIATADRDSWLIRNNLTTKKWNDFQAKKITLANARKMAFDRYIRELDKQTSKKIEKILSWENHADVISLSIHVEWSKQYNATATVLIVDDKGNAHTYTGRAGGYGYDKLTSAIASAINNDSSLRGMLCDVKEKALRKGAKMPGKWNDDNREIIHYGAGYGAIPYFEGGVGQSSMWGVFEKIGLHCVASDRIGKYNDSFYFMKEV